MTIQTKRLFVLFILTACALACALGVTRLAQARSVDLLPHEPSAPAGLDVLTLTLSSSRPNVFFDPGPQSENRTVYFNNQGAGQIVSVTAAISSSQPISTFQGAPAFGITPTMVLTTPWLVSYTIGVSDGLQPAVAFTVVATGGLSASQLITFTPDLTEPAGLITAPAYSNISFTLHFTSSDGGSGVAQTAPWFRPPATTTWRPAGPITTSLSGALPFSPTHGEGAYWFSTIVTDQVGNQWSGLTDAVETLFDIAPPAGVITGPAVISNSQIALHWWATDTLSGPAETQLWVRPPNTTTWSAGGASQPGLSGTVTYTAATPGRHYFAAIATDRAGNQEMTPTLSGEMATLYDPNPPVITGLLTSSSHPAQFYDPADGTVYFTGSQTVTITVVWTDTNPASLRAGPAFGFTPTLVVAPPWAVSYTIPVSPPLQTTVPLTVSDGGGLTDTARLTFTHDISPPAALLTAPLFAAAPVSITFEGSDPGGSGVAELHLWTAELPTATWGATGLVTTVVTGTFLYTPAGEGVYAWGAVGADHVGNVSPTPVLTNLQTVYDTTRPDSQASAPPLATSVPISVHFVSTDTLSGVDSTELWARPPNTTTWAATGLTQNGISGTFHYDSKEAGRIFFAAVAVDLAGNRTITPTGDGDISTLYDPGAPVITAIAAASSQPSLFYNPGLTAEGGTVYFSNPISQVATLTVAWAEINKAGLIGAPAFGITPTAVVTQPWAISYTIGVSATSQPAVRLLVSDTVGLTDTAFISFTRDISAPIGSASATPYANVPFTVNITADDAGGSGVAASELWYRPPTTPTWQPSGLVTSALSAAWLFTPTNGEGTYYFGMVVTDQVGNLSQTPVPTDAQTVYDLTPPTSSLQIDDYYFTSLPVTITFWASDTLSGIAQTELWARRPDTTTWAATGLTQTGVSGDFVYSPPAGDGLYQFAARATDRAGNAESTPTAAEAAIVLDRRPPTSTVNSPFHSASSPISVTWNATDTTSGVALVTLWVSRPPTHTWEPTNLTSTQSSGVFPFALDTEGLYYFAAIAGDAAGNEEPIPSGEGDSATWFDTLPPAVTSTGILESSDYLYADGDTLYYGDDMSVVEGFIVTGIATDTVSGLDLAIFSTAFGGTPAPDLTPEVWSGIYSVSNQDWGEGQIEVQVHDKVGLDANAVFTYLRDIVPPTSTLLLIPSATTSAQITLPWQSADARSGMAQTELWTRPEEGDWASAGILQPGESGTFSYTFPAEGWRYFAAVAADRVGNQPAPPTGEGDGRVLYDRTPPDSAATSIGETNAAPITVSWTVTDSLSGVAWTELWARVGAAGWAATGMTSAELSGTFAFAPTLEDVYYFATVAQDQLGNSELPPTGAGDTAIIYDITGPTAAITVPAASAALEFVIQWSAVDPGNGVGLDPTGPFQVEYRAEGTDWTPWLTATSQLSATFGPTLPIPVAYDTSYAFRVHAQDALDNPGDPVSATVTVEKVRIYLPVVLSQFKAFSNGTFESGWSGWTHGGEMAAALSTSVVHSGQRAVLLGSPSYNCRNGVPVGSAWVETEFSISSPSTGSLAIQIWYNMWTDDTFDPQNLYHFDGLQVDINGIPVDVIPADGPIYEKPEDYCTEPSANSGWQRWQINIPHIFWGENITLRIANYNRPDKWLNTWTYIDDITLVNAP